MSFIKVGTQWSFYLLPTNAFNEKMNWTKQKKRRDYFLPIDKTLLSDEALWLIPRHFAVKPGLSQVEAWSTKRDNILQIIYLTWVQKANQSNKDPPTYVWP